MPVPDFQSITLPLLKLLSKGDALQLRDAVRELAGDFTLTTEEREERLPSGKARRFDNRVGWARFHMERAGLVVRTADGAAHITDEGRQLLNDAPPRVTMVYLREHYPVYAAFIKTTPATATTTTEPPSERTPEELIDASHQQLSARLREELLTQIQAQSPAFFEELVIDLLVKMGYGGSLGSARRVGRSRDGGIDGIIDEDPLGLDVVYIQAKRWTGSVGSPVLQGFAGSLEAKRATKGVIITTSHFSQDALDFVKLVGKRIVTIDGEQLAQLMIDYAVGLTETGSYKLYRIALEDLDYFPEA